jgi:ribosomal protein S20
MVTQDPNLLLVNLRIKGRERIRALFTDDQLQKDVRDIDRRTRYEKQKPTDVKTVAKAVRKIVTPERIREVQRALQNPDDKFTANKLRDMGERLETILYKMG